MKSGALLRAEATTTASKLRRSCSALLLCFFFRFCAQDARCSRVPAGRGERMEDQAP